jgi:ribonuclease HI
MITQSTFPKTATIYSDGSCRPLKGQSSWACEVAMFEPGQGETRYLRHGRLAAASVTLAELHGAFTGVQLALEWGATRLKVHTDSQTILQLVTVNATSKAMRDEAVAVRVAQLRLWAEQVDIQWEWVKSSHTGITPHGRVDRLARLAYEWQLPIEAVV